MKQHDDEDSPLTGGNVVAASSSVALSSAAAVAKKSGAEPLDISWRSYSNVTKGSSSSDDDNDDYDDNNQKGGGPSWARCPGSPFPAMRRQLERRRKLCKRPAVIVGLLMSAVGIVALGLAPLRSSLTTDDTNVGSGPTGHFTGPYKLKERHEGQSFFDHYNFYDGDDSLGSAGYNVYVGKKRAEEIKIAYATSSSGKGADEEDEDGHGFVYMKSAPPANKGKGKRESVRLEGKTRFDRGLFLLDLRHMPNGCGVWPAFWLTDEANWPNNGEIDIVEGVNFQNVAKTALHTSGMCSMYAHSPDYLRTGSWDWATGIPNTFTGTPDFQTAKEADDCWVMAAHQWGNQGCVAVSEWNTTLGAPLNAAGGGTVSGNRYFTDCPAQAAEYKIKNDPVKSCEAYIASEPDALKEAYWKIRGVYVYEREWERKRSSVSPDDDGQQQQR